MLGFNFLSKKWVEGTGMRGALDLREFASIPESHIPEVLLLLFTRIVTIGE